MKDTLSFNDILAELQNNPREVQKGNYIFKELTLKQQRQILNSTYEPVEIPARISNIYNNYITDSVSLADDMIKVDKVITLDKKFYFLNVLRCMSLGNDYVPGPDGDGEKESDTNNEESKQQYKLYETVDADFESTIEIPEDIKFGNFSLALNLPTIALDKTYNSLLLNALKPFKKKKISDADLGAVADTYQMYELMKFVKSITYATDSTNTTFVFDEISPADKIKLLNSLPRSAADLVTEFIKDVKKNDDKALTATDETTGETTVVDSNTLFFSKGNQ